MEELLGSHLRQTYKSIYYVFGNKYSTYKGIYFPSFYLDYIELLIANLVLYIWINLYAFKLFTEFAKWLKLFDAMFDGIDWLLFALMVLDLPVILFLYFFSNAI
jgi:hypothetical protein